MIDVAAVQKFFENDISPREFAEFLHGIMADYVRVSCFDGDNANLKVIGHNIDILEEFRSVVLKCETSNPEP